MSERKTRMCIYRNPNTGQCVDPRELDEFDQWANDISKNEINKLLDEGEDILGLKVWDKKFIGKEQLRDMGSFGVDLIINKKDKESIERILDEYERKEEEMGYSPQESYKVVDKIYRYSVFTPIWV